MTEQQPEMVRQQAPKHKNSGYVAKLIILLIIALLVGGALGYWWRDRDAKNAEKKQQDQITELQKKSDDLAKELEAEKAKSAGEKPATSIAPSQKTIDNIKDSITSGNTAALEGYMASKVLVIIAASEGIGNRTPEQAVSDITSYISSATDPWNFSLPAATISGYASGGYAQYFPSTAVVGRSANKMVISFSFDNAGKINGVFMATNDDLL